MRRVIQPLRQQRSSRGGIALLMVITTLMFLSVLVTDLNYTSRVRLLMATHQRDEAMSYWLSRGGVNLYQLILVANKELSKNESLAGAAAMFGVNLGDALWQMVPAINTGLLRMLFVSGGDLDEDDLEDFQQDGVSDQVREESRESTGRFSDSNFLDFEGDFFANIEDEDSKVNIASLSTQIEEGGDFRQLPAARQLYGIMSGQEHDQWFLDRNLDRWELIGHLKDWVDADTQIAAGLGGYEDNFYNRLEPPYLAKNAPLDSKEEIRLIEGWQGEVFERYGDKLTLYGEGKININTADREVMTGLLKAYVSPQPPDLECERILQDLDEYKLLASFSKAKDFVNWLSSQISGELDSALEKAITTSSTIFTVTSTGQVGETTTTITAVFDFSQSNQGKVVYWRVD